MTFDDLDQWLHRVAPRPMFWVVTIGVSFAALSLYLTLTLRPPLPYPPYGVTPHCLYKQPDGSWCPGAAPVQGR